MSVYVIPTAYEAVAAAAICGFYVATTSAGWLYSLLQLILGSLLTEALKAPMLTILLLVDCALTILALTAVAYCLSALTSNGDRSQTEPFVSAPRSLTVLLAGLATLPGKLHRRLDGLHSHADPPKTAVYLLIKLPILVLAKLLSTLFDSATKKLVCVSSESDHNGTSIHPGNHRNSPILAQPDNGNPSPETAQPAAQPAPPQDPPPPAVQAAGDLDVGDQAGNNDAPAANDPAPAGAAPAIVHPLGDLNLIEAVAGRPPIWRGILPLAFQAVDGLVNTTFNIRLGRNTASMVLDITQRVLLPALTLCLEEHNCFYEATLTRTYRYRKLLGAYHVCISYYKNTGTLVVHHQHGLVVLEALLRLLGHGWVKVRQQLI